MGGMEMARAARDALSRGRRMKTAPGVHVCRVARLRWAAPQAAQSSWWGITFAIHTLHIAPSLHSCRGTAVERIIELPPV